MLLMANDAGPDTTKRRSSTTGFEALVQDGARRQSSQRRSSTGDVNSRFSVSAALAGGDPFNARAGTANQAEVGQSIEAGSDGLSPAASMLRSTESDLQHQANMSVGASHEPASVEISQDSPIERRSMSAPFSVSVSLQSPVSPKGPEWAPFSHGGSPRSVGYSSPSVISDRAAKLEEQGKFREAEPLRRKAVEVAKAAAGDFDPETIEMFACLARLLPKLGKFKEALQFFRRVSEDRKARYGPTHRETVAAISDVAVICQLVGNFKEAQILHRKSLEVRESELGHNDPLTLWSAHQLATVLQRLHKSEVYPSKEATELYRRAFTGRNDVLGTHHPQTQLSKRLLLRMEKDAKDLDQEGESWLQAVNGASWR